MAEHDLDRRQQQTSPGSGYGTGTSTGTLTIANGGEVTSTNAIMVGANVGATGTINIGAAVGQAAVAPGSISAPAIEFGAGGGTIVFNHTSADYVFAIPIEGGGSVDVESGTTVLTATNTYTVPPPSTAAPWKSTVRSRVHRASR